jgi:hypothetical protein
LAWLPVLLLSGCDLNGGDSKATRVGSVPARAQRSAERLQARERPAAEALVRLESAARRRDAEKLCHSIYLFAGGVPSGCEDTMKRLFPTRDGYSLVILSIRLVGRGRATAATRVLTIDANGRRVSAPNTTFRLARRAGTWRVVYIT